MVVLKCIYLSVRNLMKSNRIKLIEVFKALNKRSSSSRFLNSVAQLFSKGHIIVHMIPEI